MRYLVEKNPGRYIQVYCTVKPVYIDSTSERSPNAGNR